MPTTTGVPTMATAATSDASGLTVPRRNLVLVAAVIGAGLIIATAVIHLHLWLAGYRHVAKLDIAFMGQAVSGFVLAAALLVLRHPLLVALGALYMAGSAGALVLSATVGFLGIHDGLGVPWAGWSLGVELAGVGVMGAAAALHFLLPRSVVPSSS